MERFISEKFCNEIKKELHIKCCYGYDINEYLLVDSSEANKVVNFIQERHKDYKFSIWMENVGVQEDLTAISVELRR